MAQHDKDGLKGASAGQSPGPGGHFTEGRVGGTAGADKLPQYISVPIPYVESAGLKAGVNYFPDLPDNFFTPNEFPPCNVNLTAVEIMKQNESNQ